MAGPLQHLNVTAIEKNNFFAASPTITYPWGHPCLHPNNKIRGTTVHISGLRTIVRIWPNVTNQIFKTIISKIIYITDNSFSSILLKP